MHTKQSTVLYSGLVCALLVLSCHSQVCAQSQYFNGQRCAPCKANCKCSSDNTCDSCLSGYAFDARFENCLQCPLSTDLVNIGCKQCCSQISGTAFVCSQCLTSNFVFMRGGQCIKAQGCLNLLVSGVCTSCENQYYLTEGKCVQCDASCQTCNDNTFCLSCKQGYFNSTNVNYSFCSVCPVGCETCTSATACQSCSAGYYLSGTTCVACSGNCLACTATGCTSCNAVSTLIAGLCYLCTDAAKSGTVGCQTCQTVSNLISCLTAAPGYYINNGQSIACLSTYSNSLSCTSSNPLQCLNDYDPILTNRYHLVSNQCIANTKSCKIMKSTNGQCSQCYFQSPDMYYKLSSNECIKCDQVGCKSYSATCQCLECQQGYRYVNNLCVACQNLHCTKCQNDVQSCQNCATYYGIFSSACVLCSKTHCLNCDGDYTQCKKCQDGYYLNSGSCYLCQTNCLLCESNIKCTQCANGHYLQSNGRCKQNPTHCLQVDSKYLSYSVAVCKKCEYGYRVIQGNCYPCSQTLYNLNSCEKYCPSYYALHAFGFNLGVGGIFSVLLVVLLIFL